mgnify:CR=1 FL=1
MTQPIDYLALIESTVKQSATEARENAGYAGSMDDGGAVVMQRQLEYFLDGVRYARTGVTTKYDHIIERAQREADPDYQKYLELKSRFG